MSAADVPTNLLLVAAAREVAYANCRPAELGHHLCKVAICAGITPALWDFEQIQDALCTDPFETVEPCRPAHALQAQAPRIYGLRGFGLGCF